MNNFDGIPKKLCINETNKNVANSIEQIYMSNTDLKKGSLYVTGILASSDF